MESASENQSTDNSAESTTESTFQHQQEIEEGMTYFNCKKCSCTITYNSIDSGNNYKENVDPNVPHSGICKSCTSAEKFQQSIIVAGTPGYSSAEDHHHGDCEGNFSSTTFTSPLTQSSSSVRSSSAGREEEEQQQLVLDNNVYSVGKTHLVALSVKAPKNSSNYNVMNFYSSIGVYDQDFEMQMKDGGVNDKRIDKLYFGVDVIYKTDRKTFTCIPLLCPAKVYWDSLVGGSDQGECEVIVGISYDTNNHVYPIVAIYDAFRQFKNLAKTKTLIHTKFSRMAPTSISHDFTEAELDHFSKELIKFLCIKSAVEVKEGENLFILLLIISYYSTTNNII